MVFVLVAVKRMSFWSILNWNCKLLFIFSSSQYNIIIFVKWTAKCLNSCLSSILFYSKITNNLLPDVPIYHTTLTKIHTPLANYQIWRKINLSFKIKVNLRRDPHPERLLSLLMSHKIRWTMRSRDRKADFWGLWSIIVRITRRFKVTTT